MNELIAARKLQRTALQNTVSKCIRKADILIPIDNSEHCDEINNIITKLKDYRAKISDLSNEILLGITEAESLGEAQTASDYDDEIFDKIVSYTNKVTKFNEPKDTVDLNVSTNSNRSFNDSKSSVRLPKLEIAKFSGDPLKWQQFWDSFNATIHNNNDLCAVDKFKYLITYLEDPALGIVEGYQLTSANYDTVVEALKERFGNPQLAIFSHLEAMLGLPVASRETHQLQATYDNCEKHIRSLIALGLSEEMFGQIFTPIILSKLPVSVKMELYRKNGPNSWTLQNLREFLKEEIRARDMSLRTFASGSKDQKPNSTPAKTSGAGNNNNNKPQRPTNNAKGTSASLVTNSTTPTKRCSYCSATDHYSDQCTVYTDVVSRKERVKGRCFICLSKTHMVKECPNPRPCFHCKKNGHNRSLCPSKFKSSSDNSASLTVNAETNPDPDTGSRPLTSTLLSHGEKVILQTARAKIQNTKGQSQSTARLLFDTACSRTFITSKIAKRIAAVSTGTESVSIAGFADKKRKSVSYPIVQFSVVLMDGTTRKITANVIDTISCPVQKLPLDTTKYPVINQLVLAEPIVKSPEMVEIDILIGGDYYYDFIGQERIRCDDGLLFLSSSFGFIATGKITDWPTLGKDSSALSLLLSGQPSLQTSTFDVERFWTLEDIGVKTPVSTNQDEEALKMFNDSIKFKNGRYEVQWPWRTDHPDLPENYHLVFGRLKSLLKRIGSDEKIFQLYDQTIKDQIEKGVVEEAPEVTEHKVHYIPHHCVLTPTKTTTKLRIVYDASAKASKTQPSLNECLYRGPVLLDDLCGLIIRFRLFKIALVSDIEKAFLQVGLQECCRDVTRFLWVKDPTKAPTGDNLITFRFQRVPFGVNSSPFLLGGTVLHHLNHSENPAANDIKGDIYVDNVFNGKETVGEAIQFYKNAKSLFHSASMNLREWYTNSTEVEKHFAEADRGKSTVTMVLGMTWDTTTDTLSCSSLSIPKDTVNTKRLMLRYLSKVFDPCGYFSAVTIVGKLLIQKLWTTKASWDDKLDSSYISEWNSCATQLQQISSFKMKRTILTMSSSDYELHCFCDASAKAYSAIIYLKTTTTEGSVAEILFAKARVAPVKVLSIPRLELMAALIGSRLLKFVEDQLRRKVTAKYIWSDSKCVLHWIAKSPVSTPFVANRVREIKTQSDVKFRYVPTTANPADLSTRACSFEALANSKLWWKGPPWLTSSSENWPENISVHERPETNDYNDLLEASTNKEETTLLQSSDPVSLLDSQRFSTLNRLLRVTAWVFRFLKKLKKQPSFTGNLTSDEVADAERYWIQSVQKAHLSENSKLVNDLKVYKDEYEVLRCGSRLQFADLPDETKNPIVLPKHCHFTTLVVKDCHERLFHGGGIAHTLSQLRYKYWVIHGRSQVKKILRKSLICKLKSLLPFKTPPLPPLPECRVSKMQPFASTGLDYLGPLFIKADNTGNLKKIWICLFTCTAIRAIHLEVIEDLTTQQFLLCFRRFVAHCGKPKLLISDNAKQFVAAQKTFDEIWKAILSHKDMQDYATKQGIRWKFITELAPWMGGFYERLIGLVKKSLKSSLDRRVVNLTEIQTLSSEISTMLNSRPLLYCENEVSEPPLTPMHFLGGARAVLPQFTLSESDPNFEISTTQIFIAGWKRIQSVTNAFWNTWNRQYLTALRNIPAADTKKRVSNMDPKVGTVVQIGDNLPRSQWKWATIEQLILSNDGVCRTVILRLPNGKKLRRPVRLLYPFELADSSSKLPKKQAATTTSSARPKRQCAIRSAEKTKQALELSSSDSESC